ncbi:hypothetical protein IT412_02015 [Candidatus Peregrinibacteria bacterium]|nr:hypothetical protein [Candidatus Peregrinibacteria bacterium]
MAPPKQQPELDITSAKAQAELAKDAPKPAKPEVEDLREKVLNEQKNLAKLSINTANTALKIMHAEFSPEMQTYLEQYFQGAINTYDKDRDGKIDKDEAKKFSEDMVIKIGKIIKENTPDSATKNAKEKAEQAGAAVEKPEVTAKNVADIKEIGQGLTFATSIDEFQSIQTQNNSFQASINSEMKSIETFYGSLKTFTDSQQGFNALKRAWTKVTFNGDKLEAAEADIKSKLAAAKASAEAKLADLQGKKTILDANAEKIKTAIAAERQRLITERDQKVKEMKDNEQKQDEALTAKKQKYKELSETQQKLQKQKTELEKKNINNQEFRKKWEAEKQEERLDARKKATEDSKKDAETELEALKLIAADPALPPEAKQKVEAEIADAEKRLSNSTINISRIDAKQKKSVEVEKTLTDDQKKAGQEVNSLDAYLKGQVDPALKANEVNINRLEELKFQYATKAVEVEDYYNKKVDSVTKFSESVNEYALSTAIGRNKSIESLKSSVDTLKKIEIKSGHPLNPLNVVQGVLHGVGSSLHDLSKFMDKNAGEAMDGTDGGWHFLVQFAAGFSGFVSGGVELVGGIYTMAAHPLDTAKNMGSLIGRDPRTGEWDPAYAGQAWKGLGNALVSGDEWSKGHYGTSVGKAIFNVASMFVGAGEAGAVAKAGASSAKAAAGAARLAQIEAVLAKGGSVSFMTGRGAQIAEFARAAVIRPAVKSFEKAGEAASVEISKFGKASAYTKTLAYEAAPKFIQSATDKAALAPSRLGKVATFGWEAGKSVVKGVGGTALELYKELLIAPYTVLKGTGKILRGEGIAFATRASKAEAAAKTISAEGAQYSKAKVRLSEIIEQDAALSTKAKGGTISADEISSYIKTNPELSELHGKGGQFAAEAEAKAVESIKAHQYKNAEAEALRRLAIEDPALADSFLRVNEATQNLQQFAREAAEESLASAKKVSKDKEYIEAADQYNLLKSSREKAAQELEKAKLNNASKADITASSVKLEEAEKALSDFEKPSNPSFDKAKKYEQAQAIQKEIQPILDQQSALFKEYSGQPHGSLTRLETEAAEAKALRENDITIGTSKAHTEQLFKDYEAAIKSGKPEEITKATEAFGVVDQASELGKHLLTLKDSLSKGASASVSIDQLHKARLENFTKNATAYEEFSKAIGETPIRTAEEAAAKGLPMYETDLTKAADLKQKHPALSEAFNQAEKRQSFLNHQNEINHQLAAVRLKYELDGVVKPGMKAQEAADLLAKKYTNTKKEMGIGATDRPVSSITLEGKKYDIKLMYNGEVRLFEDSGKMLKTSPEIAQERALAKAPKKPTSTPKVTPTPAVAPVAAPDALPAFNIDNKVTTLDNTALAKQAEGSTVAYGTRSATGDWVEVTKVGQDRYIVVEVQNGKLANQLEVSNLKLAEEGTEYVFRGEIKGAPYEYRNIQEVFNPASSGGKYASEAVLPSTPVTPAVAPTAAPAATPSATPATKPRPTWDSAKAGMEEAATEYKASKLKLEEQLKRQTQLEQKLQKAEASGKYSKDVLDTFRQEIDKVKAEIQITKAETAAAEAKYSASSLDRPKALLYSVSDSAKAYLSNWPRLQKLNAMLDPLIKKIPAVGEQLSKLKNLLAEQVSKAVTIESLIETSMGIGRTLKNIWDYTHDKNQPLSALYDVILNDQLRLLRAMAHRTELTEHQVEALSTDKKIAYLNSAWSQMAAQNGFGGELYDDAQRNYIKDKQTTFQTAMDSLLNQEGVTVESVQAALDAQFGVALNNSNKAYDLTVDGVTVKVAADGKRTYVGLDKWVKDRPKKSAIDKAFTETFEEFSKIDSAKLTKLNGGKPIKSQEEFSKLVEKYALEKVKKSMNGLDFSSGLKANSRITNDKKEPNFSADISETGKVDLKINSGWLNSAYESSKTKAPVKPVGKPKAVAKKVETSSEEEGNPYI